MPRDDENWLKTTLATYQNGQAVLSYEPVDISLVKPRARTYGKTAPTPTADAAKVTAVSPASPVATR